MNKPILSILEYTYEHKPVHIYTYIYICIHSIENIDLDTRIEIDADVDVDKDIDMNVRRILLIFSVGSTSSWFARKTDGGSRDSSRGRIPRLGCTARWPQRLQWMKNA